MRYGEIHSAAEVVYRRQSDFSPKEVLYPVSRTMFFFRDGQVEEAEEADERDILLFLRACDIHAIERLDQIFLTNGGTSDSYYKKAREKVHFVLMECTESFEHCFCASLGTGAAENYDMAVRFEADRLLVETKSDVLSACFASEKPADYTPVPVAQNQKKLRIPEICGDKLQKLAGLELWDTFNDRCIACGGCNMVCGGCSCFDTVDVRYSALKCLECGVPEEKIWVSFERKMQCAVGKCGHCKVDETYVCLEGPVFRYDEAKSLFR